MTFLSAEMSYPIGAFGKRKCDEVAQLTGVVFEKFNPANRRNGFQNIQFKGPNNDAISKALDLLDAAVSKFNRHKAWEKKMRIAHGIHATMKRVEPATTTSAQHKTRYSGLSVDEASGPTEHNVSSPSSASGSGWKRLDVSTMMPSMIATRKANVWEKKAEERKKKYAAAPAAQVLEESGGETYMEKVAKHKEENDDSGLVQPVPLPTLPEPPEFAQIAWHEADMSRPMLEPSTGPLPIDKEYQAAFREWQKNYTQNNPVPPSEDELLDEASKMFELYHQDLPTPPVTEEEIEGEYDEWELEHSVALNVLDEAIAEREQLLYRFAYTPPDHFIDSNGELYIMEKGVVDPVYLSACPC